MWGFFVGFLCFLCLFVCCCFVVGGELYVLFSFFNVIDINDINSCSVSLVI